MSDMRDLFRPHEVRTDESREATSLHLGSWNPDDSLGGQSLFSAPDLDVLDGRWETGGELAQLLRGSTARREQAPAAHDFAPYAAPPPPPLAPPTTPPTTPPAAPPTTPAPDHRRRPVRWTVLRRKPTRTGTLSFAFAAVTATIVAMVSLLGGMIAQDPIRHLASTSTTHELAGWWPLLVFGPWTVASLSILRAALHRRRAPNSWGVMVLFSTFALLFCLAHAPRTPTGVAVASLPSIAALSCFHQLVRQITLTRPPRRTVSGHRAMAKAAQQPL